MILATAETAITIIAASTPVLRVLIKNTMQLRSSRGSSGYVYSQNTQRSQDTADFELPMPPSPIKTLERFDTAEDHVDLLKTEAINGKV
jgi:hypothetical protein